MFCLVHGVEDFAGPFLVAIEQITVVQDPVADII